MATTPTPNTQHVVRDLLRELRRLNDTPSPRIAGNISLGDGQERTFGTNHMIGSECNAAGTTKWCTCGWRETWAKEDNWLDIRKAADASSRHLSEHARRGERRKNTESEVG